MSECKKLWKRYRMNEETLKHDLLKHLANGPALVLMIHPICLLETFTFWRLPRLFVSFTDHPITLIPLLEIPGGFSQISGCQIPTSSSFRFPLSLFPLHNSPASVNTSPILSEDYLKDCKVYWTLTTPHLYLLSANDSKKHISLCWNSCGFTN